jgi:hypothetical protein
MKDMSLFQQPATGIIHVLSVIQVMPELLKEFCEGDG